MSKRFLILAFAALAGAANAQFFDNFNRADSTNMGPNWTEQSGDFQVLNNRAQTFGAAQTAWMSVNGYSAAPTAVTLSADVFEYAAGVTYVSLDFGVASETQQAFIKIQDNDANGLFDKVFFYYGNNGSSLGSFNLATQTASAHISVHMTNSDTVQFDVDRDFNGTVDESFTQSGFAALTLGTGVGTGIYGNGAIDNFSASTVPEPMTFAGLSFGFVALLRRRKK